jgi:hypothetical protein
MIVIKFQNNLSCEKMFHAVGRATELEEGNGRYPQLCESA